MDTARLSSKGQVTIPINIRRKLGLKEGENVIFIEKFGNVIITSENKLSSVVAENVPNEASFILSQFNETIEEPFITPEGFLPKEERCIILNALIGSVNDPTMIEPLETKYESPRDWKLMDQ